MYVSQSYKRLLSGMGRVVVNFPGSAYARISVGTGVSIWDSLESAAPSFETAVDGVISGTWSMDGSFFFAYDAQGSISRLSTTQKITQGSWSIPLPADAGSVYECVALPDDSLVCCLDREGTAAYLISIQPDGTRSGKR